MLVCISPASSQPVQMARVSSASRAQTPNVSAPPSASGQIAANQYTCPMDPDVRQQGPGDCPKCGMALEPVHAAAPATKVEYTCPMHPQIIRDKPGSCPICGMV